MEPLGTHAGLGFQLSYEYPGHEPLEYEQTQAFNALRLFTGKAMRHGIKSINWLSFVHDSLLTPLGGRQGLENQAARINHHLRRLA